MKRNSKNRKGSSLSIFENLSPNSTSPRNQVVKRLTPHSVAGNLTVEAILNLRNFKVRDINRGASCNYAIDSRGRIGLGVFERNRPWTTSSAINDHRAITFEIANITGAPEWRMSDTAINAWIDLSVDICKFYEYKKINYQPKPTNIRGVNNVELWINEWEKPDEMIITLHNWYAAKACPGAYFTRQIPWLVNEINKRLKESSTDKLEKYISEGVNASITFRSYLITLTSKGVNVRVNPNINSKIVTTLINDKNVYTIIDEFVDSDNRRWGRLKSRIGWILLKYTNKLNN